jgi:SAM-dependent methyltransferase
VADHWRLLSTDDAERRAFADLASVQRWPAEPAGPRNRLRHVQRLRTPVGVCYLKTFVRTQWQNRVRFRCSAPTAADDAEREWRVTEALRTAGFAAPRPLAIGRTGASSFYLCAALPGRSLRELLADGALGAGLPRAIAEHCGRLFAAGFELPDLSADHVFVTGAADAATPSLAVLDLHNGTLRRPGPARRRPLLRMLRRFGRSLREFALPWPGVLAAVVRLLRRAGHGGAAARALLRRLPPWATADRYERSGKSRAYAERNPTRARRELDLLRAVWPGRAGETVLDLPCGTGRLLPLLRDDYGHRVLHADGALAMLLQARTAGLVAPAVQADALAMPFRDRAVDGVVMFRFLHHLAPELAQQAIAEACRLARRFVVVSFFHRCSAHQLRRALHRLLGAAPTRFPTTLGALARSFARHGFAPRRHRAELPFARDLWLVAFERTSPAAGDVGNEDRR